MDCFNDVLCWKLNYNFRQMAYNWEPGIERVEKDSGEAWFGEYYEIVQPEQYRYIADLILHGQDNRRTEDNFLWIPALQRSLRLSDASHCSPIFTFSDLTRDYVKAGCNGDSEGRNFGQVGVTGA